MILPLSSTHIVPTIDNEASGPSYSVMSLCRALPKEYSYDFIELFLVALDQYSDEEDKIEND